MLKISSGHPSDTKRRRLRTPLLLRERDALSLITPPDVVTEVEEELILPLLVEMLMKEQQIIPEAVAVAAEAEAVVEDAMEVMVTPRRAHMRQNLEKNSFAIIHFVTDVGNLAIKVMNVNIKLSAVNVEKEDISLATAPILLRTGSVNFTQLVSKARRMTKFLLRKAEIKRRGIQETKLR